MAGESDRTDLARLVGELTRALTDLQRDLRDERGRGLERFVRLTSEVTIPAAILLLETNIRALRLLQRALRIADDREPTGTGTDAVALGQSVVDRLDDALAEVQSTVETAGATDRTRERLAEVRERSQELERKLDDAGADDATRAEVDVDAELASLKDALDEDGEGESGTGSGGNAGTDDTGGADTDDEQ